MKLRIGNYYSLVLWRVLLLYILYTLCRVFFLFFNHELLEPVTGAQLWRIFKGGLLFDTSAILYTNILYLLLAFIPAPFVMSGLYQKFLKYIYVIINFITISINLGDTVYFRFTLRRTSTSFFNEFTGDVKFFKIFTESIMLYWGVFIIGILMLAALIYLSGRYGKTARLYTKNMGDKVKFYNFKDFGYKFYLRQALALVVVAPLFIVGVRGGVSAAMKPITIGNAGDYVDKAIHASAVLNTPFSLIRTIGKNDYTYQNFYPSYQAMDSVFTPVHPNLNPDSSATAAACLQSRDVAIKTSGEPLLGKNIVILLLEGFGTENMYFLNKDLEKSYTPFLDSLSKHSLLCTNAFANGRKSIDAMPSVFNSLPSMLQSYAVTPYSTNDTYGLPKILDSLGYYTAFLHGAPNTSMGIRAASSLCGVKNYFGKDEYNNNDHFDGSWGIYDEHFLQFAAAKIGEFPQPFFANVFTLSSHHPFKLPDEYKDVYTQGTPRQRVIEYSDMAVRKFFELAVKQPWFKNTLFIILPDHATLAGEQPVYSTTIGNTRIPIMFYSPGFIEPGEYAGVTQQIDIMPTLLGMLGYTEPYFAFGRDINKPANYGGTSSDGGNIGNYSPEFAVNYTQGQFQMVIGDTLLFRDNDKLKAVYLLNEDPLLKNNLIGEGAAGAEELKASAQLRKQDNYFKAFIQQYVNRLIDNKLFVE